MSIPGKAALDILAFALVVGVVAWFLVGWLGEEIRRRWGFFGRACGHGHYGSAMKFRCGGEDENGGDCPCLKVFP